MTTDLVFQSHPPPRHKVNISVSDSQNKWYRHSKDQNNQVRCGKNIVLTNPPQRLSSSHAKQRLYAMLL